jgi:hypothetical protein
MVNHVLALAEMKMSSFVLKICLCFVYFPKSINDVIILNSDVINMFLFNKSNYKIVLFY